MTSMSQIDRDHLYSLSIITLPLDDYDDDLMIMVTMTMIMVMMTTIIFPLLQPNGIS